VPFLFAENRRQSCLRQGKDEGRRKLLGKSARKDKWSKSGIFPPPSSAAAGCWTKQQFWLDGMCGKGIKNHSTESKWKTMPNGNGLKNGYY
jgi:hypothetical protein